MAENVLIEQVSRQQGEDMYNSLYVRLAVDAESGLGLGSFSPDGIVVEEKFGQPYVECRLSLHDTIGSLVNGKIIEGGFIFTLYIGKSPEDYQVYKLKMRSYRVLNQNMGESSGYRVEINLVSDFWEKMCHERVVKGWKDVKFSDSVNEILEDCGLTKTLVSDTVKTQTTTICPYWTNAEMLSWISKKSKGSNGDTFFTYGAIANDMFYFCTFGDMINGDIQSIFEFEQKDPRYFSLSGEPSESSSNGEEFRQLLSFKVLTNYARHMSKGASGVQYGYYDFNNRSYITGEHKYSESDERQLSDWAHISEDQENVGYFHFGDRDVATTENSVHQQVSREVNGILNVIASTKGTTDVQVGELVKLIIPVNPDHFTTQFNEFFSGKYVMSAKKTFVNLSNNTAETSFRLTRQGVNGAEVTTLVQSNAGKVV